MPCRGALVRIAGPGMIGCTPLSGSDARWCANRSAVVLLLPQVVIERMARLTLWRYGLLASMLVRSMPYKFNESRRHKIPKARYRVTNWPEYDAAPVKRGSLTVWMTEEAIAAWQAPATGKRGGQPIYSAIAVETSLALRLVFHQPLRQTEGLLRSIVDALEINIPIPDHTTLSRRGGGLTILPKRVDRAEPLHLLVDSTGLKI